MGTEEVEIGKGEEEKKEESARDESGGVMTRKTPKSSYTSNQITISPMGTPLHFYTLQIHFPSQSFVYLLSQTT